MINKTWSRKFIAMAVAAAVLSVSSMLVLASPGARSGELSVSGDVTVNGQKAISGGTIFSNSVIVTSKDSRATIGLGKIGRIELMANTSVRVSFTDNNISGLLDAGQARLSTPAGVTVNLTTKDGVVNVDGTQATTFTVGAADKTSVNTEVGVAELKAGNNVTRIAAGESGASGTPQTTTSDDDGKLSTGALAAILLATGGAVAVILLTLHHDDDLNFGGTVVVISPTK